MGWYRVCKIELSQMCKNTGNESGKLVHLHSFSVALATHTYKEYHKADVLSMQLANMLYWLAVYPVTKITLMRNATILMGLQFTNMATADF